MKRISVLFLAVILAYILSSCGFDKGYEYYSADPADSKTEQQDNAVSQTEQNAETSIYSVGTVKVYAENDSYDYYDMVFSNNRLIFVDLEDSNGMFEGNCKGTFGKDAPNHILLSGMTELTVESAIEFFEGKGFEVTVTQE